MSFHMQESLGFCVPSHVLKVKCVSIPGASVRAAAVEFLGRVVDNCFKISKVEDSHDQRRGKPTLEIVLAVGLYNTVVWYESSIIICIVFLLLWGSLHHWCTGTIARQGCCFILTWCVAVVHW